MIKILIEEDKNGNRTKVLEHDDGVLTLDIVTAISSPLMKLILDVYDNDRQKSSDMLMTLLDTYIEANGDEDGAE